MSPTDPTSSPHNALLERIAADAASAVPLLDAIDTPIVVVNRQGVVISFNQAAEALSGFPASELVGRPYWDRLPVDGERESLRRAFRDAQTLIIPSTLVGRWRVRDGRTIVMEWRTSTLLDETGEVRLVMALGHDMTDPWAVAEALRRSEANFRSLIELLPEALLVHRGGVIVYANAALVRLVGGHSAEQLLGRAILDFVDPVDRALVMSRAARLSSALGTSIPRAEEHLRRLDGSSFVGEVCGLSLLIDDQPSNLLLIRDVTHRRLAEQALRDSERRYALAARASNSGLWEWTFATSSMYMSPRFKELLGYADDEMYEDRHQLLQRMHPEDREWVLAEVQRHLQGDSPRFEAEARYRLADGSWRWYLITGMISHDEHGEADRVVGSLTDIHERRRAEQQVQREAWFDRLTGLPNRSQLLDRLRRTLERTDNIGFALLFLDLDRFKLLNDSQGHQFGDEVLVEVSARLQKCVRLQDMIARFGGDEFALLLDRVGNVGEATRVAERVHRQLERPILVQGREVFTSASIGIAFAQGQYRRAEDLLRDADNAMHSAKSHGRAQHVVFDHQMHTHAVERLHLETDLRRALERGEFVVLYQPLVSLELGVVTGFEALVRWRHPKRGLVSPEVFIPTAEETGLILPLGMWVFHEACRQLVAWTEEMPECAGLTVSVNLSGRQFQQLDLVEQIEEILFTTGCSGGRVHLEVTESTVMGDVALATQLLGRLRALDIHICIDDFGTGYSSLSHLHRFPIDTLKIDRSFVATLDQPNSDDAMVRSIIALGHHLGMGVVAEGIEREPQLALLRELGCDGGQGYLFTRPMTAGEAAALIAENPRW